MRLLDQMLEDTLRLRQSQKLSQILARDLARDPEVEPEAEPEAEPECRGLPSRDLARLQTEAQFKVQQL